MRPLTTVFSLILITLFSPAGHAASEKPEVTFSGFFDGYYSYNFNNPKQVTSPSPTSVSSAAMPVGNNSYRYYDTYHNQLSLSLAELSVRAAYKNAVLVTDFDFGTFADMNATMSSPSGSVTDESSKHIGQAVLSYHAPDSRFYFDAGKMYSYIGVETVKSKDNFNYSRSILFSYAPFWHTGVRLGYDVVPGQIQASLFVLNGWNTLYDVNRTKTLGAQIRITPNPDLAIVYNFIGGPERVESESDWKMVHELNGSLNVSSSLSIIADALYGTEQGAINGVTRQQAKWYGALAGLKYVIDEISYVSPRAEIYRDENGVSLGNGPQTVTSLTFTYGRQISEGFDARLEVRSDSSDAAVFPSDTVALKSQTTALAAGLFKF